MYRQHGLTSIHGDLGKLGTDDAGRLKSMDFRWHQQQTVTPTSYDSARTQSGILSVKCCLKQSCQHALRLLANGQLHHSIQMREMK